MYPLVCALNAGDAAIGRRLCRYFGEAGIGEPELRLAQSLGTSDDNDTKALAVSTLEGSAQAIVAAGLATADEVAAALADLTAFAGTAGTLVGDPRTFQVWAHRPFAARQRPARPGRQTLWARRP